jgi:hypothetical protein
VRAISRRGSEASGDTNAQGKFEFKHLGAGHWTVIAKFSGSKEQRHVVLKAHKTVRVRFTFDLH